MREIKAGRTVGIGNLRNHCKPWKFAWAREKRKDPTPAERMLWQRLRGKAVGGVRFHRQSVILGWIADFYCPKFRLVVEVDGGCHADRQEYDAARDQAMAEHDLRVIRFTNEQVFKNMPGVLMEIERVGRA